jgi:hypothetical protein
MYLLGQNEHILGHSSGTLEYTGQLVAVYELVHCDGSVLVAQSTKTRNILVEETGVPRENHRAFVSHWQTLSHNVVSHTPRHEGIRSMKEK